MVAIHVGLLYFSYVAWRLIGNITSMYHRHIIRQHLFNMKLSLQNSIVTTNDINISVIGHLCTVLAGIPANRLSLGQYLNQAWSKYICGHLLRLRQDCWQDSAKFREVGLPRFTDT